MTAPCLPSRFRTNSAHTAPVEDWSDEESGDIPFTTAPDEKNGAQDTKEDEEDDEDEEMEEGV